MAAGDAGIGSADDIGNLKPRPRHGCRSPPDQEAFAANRGCECVRGDWQRRAGVAERGARIRSYLAAFGAPSGVEAWADRYRSR